VTAWFGANVPNGTEQAATVGAPLRLSDFIRANVEPIVREWTNFAKTRTPAADVMSSLALRDHIEDILTFVSDDLESAQTSGQQKKKSRGEGPKGTGEEQSAAESHAGLRLRDGFDIDQMLSEYRALRASVVKLWRAGRSDLDPKDFDDLTRFNEAIDQATTESCSHYTKTITRSRNLFLGILGHDLRNPIGAASMSAELMLRRGGLDAKQSVLASQIVACAFRANVILTDLLDLTRLQLGSDIPVVKEPMDLGSVGRQLVEEMRAFHPEREISFEVTGDTSGGWDKSRLGQVFSNLIGNAIAHGFRDTPVSVVVQGGDDEVRFAVQNQGSLIPVDKIHSIFDSLVQGDEGAGASQGSTHLGLGLYIAKKIVEAHGGMIEVTSSHHEGTKFVVHLPR
jgi:signal transduction histidine kinase